MRFAYDNGNEGGPLRAVVSRMDDFRWEGRTMHAQRLTKTPNLPMFQGPGLESGPKTTLQKMGMQ